LQLKDYTNNEANRLTKVKKIRNVKEGRNSDGQGSEAVILKERNLGGLGGGRQKLVNFKKEKDPSSTEEVCQPRESSVEPNENQWGSGKVTYSVPSKGVWWERENLNTTEDPTLKQQKKGKEENRRVKKGETSFRTPKSRTARARWSERMKRGL